MHWTVHLIQCSEKQQRGSEIMFKSHLPTSECLKGDHSDFSQTKTNDYCLSCCLSQVILMMASNALSFTFIFKKNKKAGLCGSIRAVSPPWREADVIKLFHLAACFCSTDTVERLAHPVELLLQPRVHSRCGRGSRMWQNNPGITVNGVCGFFFSHTDTERRFM